MKGMKGQWEQEIDWQRTHWDEVEAETERVAKVQENMNTEKRQRGRSQTSFIVCK